MTSPAKYVSDSAAHSAAGDTVVHINHEEAKSQHKAAGLDALSVQQAIDHANKIHPRAKINGKLVPFPIWSFEDFGQFGNGVLLYFTLLKKLMVAFLVMLGLAIPQMGFSLYFSSGQYDSFHLEQTMLSSMSVGNTSAIDIPFVGKSIAKEAIGAWTSTMDLIAILFFTFFIRSIRITLEKEAELTDQLEITASDYTVRVRNIPADLTNRQELLDFFQEKWGRVVDVVISFNDCDLVQLYLQRGRLKHEQMKTMKLKKSQEQIAEQVARISERISNIDAKIEAFQAKFRRCAVDAFVQFNSQASRDACLLKYPNTCISRTFMPQPLRFRNHRVIVTKAPEPSNILFENLKYSTFSIRLRRLITLIATVALMTGSLITIYKASETQRRIVENNDLSKCSESATPSREQAIAGVGVPCYCYSLSDNQLAAQNDVCGQWVEDRKMGNVISILIALVIAFVNAILKSSILQMVSFEKHTTLSAQERAVTVKLLVGLVVNTGIIILLVNGNLSVIGLGSIFNGAYDDFTRQWYSDVGVSVLLTMLVNVINPHIIPVLAIPVRRLYVAFFESRVSTQKDLNDLYTGPIFSISDRYATLLNTVFISLVFSPGIPALLITAAMTFGFIILFDKIAVLRLYRTPPMFDESLAIFAVNIIRYAILLHTGMAVWFYSNSDILPSYEILPDDFTSPGSLELLGVNLGYILKRIRVANSLCILIIFLIQLGQIFIHDLFATIPCCRRRSNRVSPVQRAADDNVDYLVALRTGIKIESYHMHEQPQYMDAFMRTASLRQLQPTEDMSVELSEAKLGKAGRKKKKREKSISATTTQGEMENAAKGTEQQDKPDTEPNINEEKGHKRQTTADFLDEKGMITVQCPSCAKISNILWINNGKVSQRYTCPYCGTIFAIAS